MRARLHPSRVLGLALLSVGMLVGSPSWALDIGHSRLTSRPDQPLRLDVGIRAISPAESLSLQVAPAPLAAWREARLVPPVDLALLRVSLERDAQGQVRRIRLSSDQPFSGRVADVLLQIRSDSGRSLHQVSVLVPAPVRVQPPVRSAPTKRPVPVSVVIPALPTDHSASHSSAQRVPHGEIQVRSGDTMHSLERRYAVDGVTAFQWMLAVQRRNPDAFIGHNLHRLKAGQSLQMPDMDLMLSLDDTQARKLYVDQARALRFGGKVRMGQADASHGHAQAADVVVPDAAQAQDRLRLSAPVAGADQRQAVQHQLRDAGERVSQLEENVSNLSRALQSQGEAAKDLVLDSVSELGLSTVDTPAPIQNKPATAADSAPSSAATGAAASPSGSPSVVPGPDQGKMAGAVNKAKKTVSWIQEHMLAVMAVVLALIVLIVTWVLKRANTANQDIDDSPAPVSEAMVREKLEKINLDLDQPPSDEPSVRQ